MQPISYEAWASITNSAQFMIMSAILFTLPLLIYLITGCFVKARSSNGQKTSRPMIINPNFWIAPIIFTLIGMMIYLIIIFPIWINLFE